MNARSQQMQQAKQQGQRQQAQGERVDLEFPFHVDFSLVNNECAANSAGKTNF